MDEPVFSSDHEALNYYQGLARSLQSDLDDNKLALDDFQASSKELEAELEKELQATEKQLKDLRGKEELLLHEIEQWKTKYQTCLKDHTKTMSHMQAELESCRKSNEEYRTRLRDMELDNDELEGKERMVTSSLQDVETKYGKAIERITLLEDEIIGKSKLEEEHQRLKDDFRDMAEELAIMREHLANVPIQNNDTAAGTAHVSSSPSSSPVTVREYSETEFGSPGAVETLKDADEMPSPLRPMMRTKPASSSIAQPAQDSPRRRLVSLGPNLEPSPSRPPITKSLAASQIKKSGSLRINPSGGSAAKKSLQSVFTPESLLGMSSSPASFAKSTRNYHSRNQPLPTTSSATNGLSATIGARGPNSHTTRGSSHIQSLRAETQRMQGMTQKLVGSRSLRTGSAIPVPRTFSASAHLASSLASTHPHNKSPLHLASTLNQSQIPRSPKSGAVRNFTQPPPCQDHDSDSNSISNNTRGLPRPRLSRPLSRLSTGSSDHHFTGIPISTHSSATTESQHTNNNTLLPRRKTSIDLSFDRQKLHRPLSIQDAIKDQHHLRRQSIGLVHSSTPSLRPDHHLAKSHLSPHPHNFLGKSIGNNPARLYPPKKS